MANVLPPADPGGARGAMTPPVPVKSSHKKKADTGGPLYLMLFGPPPSDHPGSDTDWVRTSADHIFGMALT